MCDNFSRIISTQKPEWLGTLHIEREVNECNTSYFEKFFADENFDPLMYQLNLYTVQTDPSKPHSVSKN